MKHVWYQKTHSNHKNNNQRLSSEKQHLPFRLIGEPVINKMIRIPNRTTSILVWASNSWGLLDWPLYIDKSLWRTRVSKQRITDEITETTWPMFDEVSSKTVQKEDLSWMETRNPKHWELSEFSREESCVRGSASFKQNARPCVWVAESFWVKGG